MREHKYRAWDKSKNRMFIVERISFCNGRKNSISNVWGCGEYDKNLIDAIPMQYTGLKDKNGKEIYESDICYHSEYKDNYEVFWEGTGFSVRSKSHKCMLTGLCQKYLQVIGNMYENPKLLEESNESNSNN